MSKDEVALAAVKELSKMTVLAIMVKHRNTGPRDAASEIADLIAGLAEEAEKEMRKLRAELDEKNKVITCLIKSNDEYADSLTQKVAEITALKAGV